MESTAGIMFDTSSLKMVNFQQLLEELRNPRTILVDCRSGEERQREGKIPGSVNFHIAEFKYTLDLNDKEFKDRFKFDRLKKKDHIIVHCKVGMRSQRFASILQERGFTDVSVYPGVVDWRQHGGLLI